ncbi:MAG: ATP-binding protein, partial [Chthoniobacteraceae bacterium]
PALFVLDNFEQLAEQGAGCIDQLLREMPQLRVLITSRHRLNLPQEREFPVPALEVPKGYLELEEVAEVESVALFVDRASQANPSFELTENNTAAVAELCRKLEGVPLALELAAARATVRTPREIVRELGARLDAFATSDPNTPARHRSLRAAVEWSFEYLPAALREFLSNLSIFRGGWTAEAAQAVAVPEHLAEVSSNVLRSLSELRALSLISAEERHDRMRFRMLETIRQYAAEQLSGEARKLLGERHLQFFHEFALEAERGCNGMDQAAWFDRIDLELDNIRAALRFPTTSDAPLLIASDLALFWVTRGHVEEMRGVLAHLQKAHPNAAPFARACTDVLAGHFALEASDYPAALKGFERALVYFEAIDDRKNIAAMLVNAGMAHRNVGSPDRAQEMMEKAVQLSREIARPQVLAPALQSLGSILLSLNRVDEAQAAFEESISIQRSIGDARMLSAALYNLADLKLELGRIEDAQPLVEECVHLRRTARERNTLASGFCMEGRLAREQKRYFAAASLNAAARLAFREFGPGAATGVEEEMEKTAAVVALHLTSEQLEAAERQGRVHLHAWLRDGD